MQNLGSLNSLLTKPVLGRNDDTGALVGKPHAEIYSYEDEMRTLIRAVDEDHRKVLSRELLTASKQD
jgi:hypothetical protein